MPESGRAGVANATPEPNATSPVPPHRASSRKATRSMVSHSALVCKRAYAGARVCRARRGLTAQTDEGGWVTLVRDHATGATETWLTRTQS